MIEELADDMELDDIEPSPEEVQLYEHFRVTVDKGQDLVRVDKYLFDKLTNVSRNRIQKAADAGYIMANEKPVKSNYRVKPLDVIIHPLEMVAFLHDLKTKSCLFRNAAAQAAFLCYNYSVFLR